MRFGDYVTFSVASSGNKQATQMGGAVEYVWRGQVSSRLECVSVRVCGGGDHCDRQEGGLCGRQAGRQAGIHAGWINGGTDGRMEGRTDGWMDGWHLRVPWTIPHPTWILRQLHAGECPKQHAVVQPSLYARIR